MNIFEKLNLAREKFHSLELKKTGHNKFANYKYFELGDFLIPALKVFKEVGLTAVVSFDKEMATMRIFSHGQKMTDKGYVPAEPEELRITSPMGSAALKGCHEVQNIGAVETYQRRYLWVAALEIVEHDALDSSEPVKESENHTPVAAAMRSIEVSEERKSELENVAMYAIEQFKNGEQEKALELALEIEDNEEKIYFWHLLRAESKLRAFIKANSDGTVKEANQR